MNGLVSFDTSPFCVLARSTSYTCAGCRVRHVILCVSENLRDTHLVSGEVLPGRVGEWLKPADCKSAAPCGLRRFESFPVHQDSNAASGINVVVAIIGVDVEVE
jgi:hypothetical protein